MMKSNDHPEMRHRLHDRWRLYGVFIGVPLVVFTYVWNMANLCPYLIDQCLNNGIINC